MIARKDTSGIEAIRPAKSEDRLAISETATITTAVIKVLIKIYIINEDLAGYPERLSPIKITLLSPRVSS